MQMFSVTESYSLPPVPCPTQAALVTFLADCCSSLPPMPTILNSQFTNRLSIPESAAASPLPHQPRLMLTVALVAKLSTEIKIGAKLFWVGIANS